MAQDKVAEAPCHTFSVEQLIVGVDNRGLFRAKARLTYSFNCNRTHNMPADMPVLIKMTIIESKNYT